MLALLGEVGEEAPVCHVGQSLGGYVAQDIVFTDPHRVVALATIGSSCTTLPISRWEQWALAT